MRHNIKHIIILALMLMGNITAWATTKTIAYHVYSCKNASYVKGVFEEGFITFWVFDVDNNYTQIGEYTTKLTSTTAQEVTIPLGDITLYMNNAPSYVHVSDEYNTFGSSQAASYFTVTLSSTDYCGPCRGI